MSHSTKGTLLTDKTSVGGPAALRPKAPAGYRAVPYTYHGNGKDRTKAYSSNRTKPRKKKK